MRIKTMRNNDELTEMRRRRSSGDMEDINLELNFHSRLLDELLKGVSQLTVVTTVTAVVTLINLVIVILK